MKIADPMKIETQDVDLAIPVDQRKTLMELGPFHCRWPVGDPTEAGFFFCGGVATDGPYCASHARRAWQR